MSRKCSEPVKTTFQNVWSINLWGDCSAELSQHALLKRSCWTWSHSAANGMVWYSRV